MAPFNRKDYGWQARLRKKQELTNNRPTLYTWPT
jgi:hypothetical protein